MRKKRVLSFLLACCVTTCLFTGCGTKKETAGEGDKLTYWMSIGSNAASIVSNYGDTEFAKELEKRTGIAVEYMHPATGQESESFNLLIASGNDLPDIIEYDWLNAMGGPTVALEEGIIIELNDVFEKYCPNLTKYLSEHPEIDKQIKTADGKYYVFPFIRGDEELLISMGPVIRQDWLDELGLEAPKTVEEWESVLRAFKEKKGIKAPLTFAKFEAPYMFMMLGVSHTNYIDNGKVKYGPYTPEYKSALETLARWYKEGLLDNNYVVADSSVKESAILNGLSGATIASGGSGLGKWVQAMDGESFDLRGIEYPVESGKNVNRFAPVSFNYASFGAAISADCDDIEKAAKFLDYAYSEEGHMLFNFGIEGQSYEMIDGIPTYTDNILNNKDGLTVSQTMAQYNRANYRGAFVQDKYYIKGYYSLPQQQEALSNWKKNADFTFSAKIPYLSYTSEETSRKAELSTEITKYVDQMTAEFITGERSFDDYDNYLKNLEKLGVNEMNKIIQTAYDRYIKN